jgi:hypothetical protein
MFGILIVIGTIWLILAIYTGLHAERNGKNGFLWFTLIFATGIFGLVYYSIKLSTPNSNDIIHKQPNSFEEFIKYSAYCMFGIFVGWLSLITTHTTLLSIVENPDTSGEFIVDSLSLGTLTFDIQMAFFVPAILMVKFKDELTIIGNYVFGVPILLAGVISCWVSLRSLIILQTMPQYIFAIILLAISGRVSYWSIQYLISATPLWDILLEKSKYRTGP